MTLSDGEIAMLKIRADAGEGFSSKEVLRLLEEVETLREEKEQLESEITLLEIRGGR